MSDGKLLDWLTALGAAEHLNSADIMSGATVQAVLQSFAPSSTITLNPSTTVLARVNNWNAIINVLQSLGIRVSQEEKTSIIQGNEKPVYAMLSALRTKFETSRTGVEVDLSAVDPKTDPLNAKSLLQLLILLLAKEFSLTTKEAVALLYNDSKYLAHVMIKGFKDDFKPVMNLMRELFRRMSSLVGFCRNKENQAFLLKSFKPGLISKDIQVAANSLRFLAQFIKNFSEGFQILKTELISTFLLCLRRHPSLLRPITEAVLEICDFHPQILALLMSQTPSECLSLACELLSVAEERQVMSKFLELSRIHEFVQLCVQSISNVSLFEPALCVVLKLIDSSLGYFKNRRGLLATMLENMQALSLQKQVQMSVFVSLLFAILSALGRRKDPLAPSILKAAIEIYSKCLVSQVNELFILNFAEILEQFPTIPAQAMLLTILGKKPRLNEMDLHFIEQVPILEEEVALRLYNTLSRQFLDDNCNWETVTRMILTLVKRDSKPIMEITVDFLKILLAMHYGNVRKLTYSKSPIEGLTKIDEVNVGIKLLNLRIEYFLRAILSQPSSLRSSVEPLFCFSFFESEKKNRQQSEPLRRIMLLLGKESELRQKYGEDEKSEKRENEGQSRSDVSLHLKKAKDSYLQMTNSSKVPMDALKGLEKYQKGFLQKKAKFSLQEDKKAQEEMKMNALRKSCADKLLEKGIMVAKDMHFQCLYEFDAKQRELERQRVNDMSQLSLYNVKEEEERNSKAVQYTLKKYSKALKVYFSMYSSRMRPNASRLFDDLHSQFVSSGNAWKFMRDHDLDQFITLREAQHIIQLINSQKKDITDASLLDFQSFEQFIVQSSVLMFSRAPREMKWRPIGELLGQIFLRLKEYAERNRVDERIFQEDMGQPTEETIALNAKLAQNAQFILPEGYKKIVERRVEFHHQICLPSFDPCHKAALQILDQILFHGLGFHIIEGYSSTVTVARARPLLYQADNQQGITPAAKKTLLRYSGTDRETAREVAVLLGQMIQSVESSKGENKALKEKRVREEEKKQREEEEEKKREQRNIQLKGLMELHRSKQSQIEKEKEVKAKEEAKRVEEEKIKKAKYEQDLKRKVSEFMEKKKEEKQKEEDERRNKQEQDRKALQKMRMDIEMKKKMIEEGKAKKRGEEDARGEREMKERKQKEEEERKKMEEKQRKAKKLLEEYKEKKSHKEEK